MVQNQAKPDIPGYRILRRLGHGGMSEIWLAEQLALARPVAVKVVSPGLEAEQRLARFRQEAAIVARFDHPNVVGIIEFGETADGRLYFSMPYVPNGTLAQAGLGGDSPRVREVLGQVLDALAYVHELGVVHRDVKPENVLFDQVGRARLADFGVSRSIESVSRHTKAGETFGSSLYMSPEQARGELPDGRSDLYSVGAIAYELLTGEPPFTGPDHLSVVVAHMQQPVPRLPDELAQWQSWIDTAMAKRPEQRFPNAAAMAAALQRIPGRPSPRRPSLAVRLGMPLLILCLLAIAIWRFGEVLWSGEGADDDIAAVAGGTPAGTDAGGSEADPFDDFDEGEAGSGTNAPVAARSSSDGQPGDAIGDGRNGDNAFGDEAAASSQPVATPPAETTPPIVAKSAETAEPGATAAASAPGPAATTPARGSAPKTTPQATRTTPAVPPRFPIDFETVPPVPLFLLAGNREQRLQRIDTHMDLGRRTIEADRQRTERLRSETQDAAQRNALRDGYDRRKANYETWRKQLLALRRRAARGD